MDAVKDFSRAGRCQPECAWRGEAYPLKFFKRSTMRRNKRNHMRECRHVCQGYAGRSSVRGIRAGGGRNQCGGLKDRTSVLLRVFVKRSDTPFFPISYKCSADGLALRLRRALMSAFRGVSSGPNRAWGGLPGMREVLRESESRRQIPALEGGSMATALRRASAGDDFRNSRARTRPSPACP